MGLSSCTKRRVQYGPINPAEARDLFIRGALVAGQYSGKAEFLEYNRRLVEDVQELEHKSRRHDVLVDDEAILRVSTPHASRRASAPARISKNGGGRPSATNPKLLFLTPRIPDAPFGGTGDGGPVPGCA